MIVRNPLGIDLEQVGVTDDMFQHRSTVHGSQHVNRVIYNALTIARLTGYTDLIPACWAAAYIHDLERKRDGACREHGMAAANTIPKYLPLFREAGVRNEDIPMIAEAVAIHCTELENEDNKVACVLKDADALDRCRIGDLDPRALRMTRSQNLVNKAEKLFLETRPQDQWMDTWKKAIKVYCPFLGLASKHGVQWNPNESGRERMLRRLRQSDTSSKKTALLDGLMLIKSGWFRELTSALQNTLRELEGKPVVYMREEAASRFMESGEYLSFWELRETGIKSWHYNFTDIPEDVRAVSELRLFGELCPKMVYGVLDVPLLGWTEPRMREMYGCRKVVLKDDVLEASTFTMGDSQENEWVLPFSREAIVAGFLARVMRFGRAPKSFTEVAMLMNGSPYIELQIHKPITKDDVKEIT